MPDCLLFWFFAVHFWEEGTTSLSKSRTDSLDLGEEEKHYGGERLSVNGSLEKTLKTLKTLKVNVSEEGKNMELWINEELNDIGIAYIVSYWICSYSRFAIFWIYFASACQVFWIFEFFSFQYLMRQFKQQPVILLARSSTSPRWENGPWGEGLLYIGICADSL